MTPIAVYLEVGSRRQFACSLDWPGWCRAGRDEPAALAALAAAAPRYAAVAERAGVAFPVAGAPAFDVVERLPGTATTDFGAPDRVAGADSRPLTAAEAATLAALVGAAWAVLDGVVAGAPAQLRKGPRGGGRDRDAIVEHVVGAEGAYARKLGIERPRTLTSAELRRRIVDALVHSRAGQPLAEKGWPPRYAARRIAWHVLDHAWEIENRSAPAG